MPKLDSEIKEQIKELSKNQLQEIVLKLAAKEKLVYDFILVNYLNKEDGEKELFNATLADLNIIHIKNYKGFSEQLQLANMLAKCTSRINEFTKLSKNKVLEADLLLYVLKIQFTNNANLLGTCFTQYDTKLAILLRRLINLITKNMHEDYKLNYKNSVNNYLQILHRTSNYIDTIYNLPKEI